MQAVKGDDRGPWSETLRLTVAQPAAVSNARAYKEGGTGVRLRWDTPDTASPTAYNIQSKAGDSGSFRNIGFVSGDETTFLKRTQSTGKTYTYRVLAQNDVGLASPTDADNEPKLTIDTPHNRESDMPGNLNLTVDGQTVTLTWDAPEQNAHQITGYRIYRKTADEFGRVDRYMLVVNTGDAATTYTDTSAEADVSYIYAVAARRDSVPDGISYFSNLAYATTW